MAKSNVKILFLYIMAGFYAFAGIAHLVNPAIFIAVFPEWLNWDDLGFSVLTRTSLVVISGVCEILFAGMLLFRPTRRFGAFMIFLMLVVYLLLIHIPMVYDYAVGHNPYLWIAIVRLPLQFVLLWWTYIYAKAPAKQ